MKIRTLLINISFLLISATAFCQVDSLSERILYTWTINPYDLNLKYSDIDTTLDSFQKYNPVLKSTIVSNYLGNLGTASQSRIYYDRRKNQTGFLFSEPYAIYFHLPYKQKYFNTKRQYTLFNYGTAGPKEESEQMLGILHTQNVNQDFNVGVDYDLISSAGRYQRQALKSHALTLFSSYQYKGYRAHANFTLNKVKGEENGGIDSLRYLGSDEYIKSRNIPVKLNDARHLTQNNSFHLVHEFRFGKFAAPVKKEKEKEKTTQPIRKGKPVNNSALKKIPPKSENIDQIKSDTLISIKTEQGDSIQQTDSTSNHSPSIDKINSEKITTDKEAGNGLSISHELFYINDMRKYYDAKIDEDFYNSFQTYFDSTKTYDAAYQKKFSNKLSANYRFKDKFSTSLSFNNEQMDYEYKIIPDTTFTINSDSENDTTVQYLKSTSESSNSVSFYLNTVLFNHILFDGYAQYFVSGDKNENSQINLYFGYKMWDNWIISIESNYSNTKPGYFYRHYSSNHFQWDNQNLIRQEEWDGSFVIKSKKYKLEARAGYGQITGHIYFGTNAEVKQYGNQINIITGELSKKFKLGLFRTDTHFVYQKSTNDSILSLPEYNLYQSFYIEKLFYFKSTGGNLLMQAGIDYRFSSSYMADGYIPVTGLFHRQYDQKLGDYHCFDIFANFTLKRARFYLIYNYLNSALNNSYFYNAPSYPAPPAVFKFGFAWTFYD